MFRPLKTSQVVVDIVVAVVFFLIAWPVETGMSVRTDISAPAIIAHGAVSLLVALVFSGALAIRRLAPGLALACAWAGAVAQMGFGRPPGFSDLAIFGVLYAAGAYGSRRAYWAGLASAIFGALVITVYLMAGPGFINGMLTWSSLPAALLMLVAAAFALGLAWTIGALVRTAVQARTNREAQHRAEEEATAEQERVRIARDMHDVVAHSLAVVIAQADGARYAAVADSDAAAKALGTISATARSALADVRMLLTQLRHSQGVGPQPTLADLEELYGQVRAAGVGLRVDVDPAPPGVPPAAVQLAVYRILQEALTNALRHGADGGPVRVQLAWWADRVELSVHNPLRLEGAGEPRAAASGHGLIGMRERAHLAGGTLTAGAEDSGFLVRASIPIGGPA